LTKVNKKSIISKANNRRSVKSREYTGVKENEKNLSTQKEDQKQSTRFQKENGYNRRQKGSEEKKRQGS